jgi:hypothetical protein
LTRNSKFNDGSSLHWTSIYKAELDPHQHSELSDRLASLALTSSPSSSTRKADQDYPPPLTKSIAIKIVSPQLNRPPHDTLTEIKTLSSLDHPNVRKFSVQGLQKRVERKLLKLFFF